MLLELDEVTEGPRFADRSVLVEWGTAAARGFDTARFRAYVRVEDEAGGRRVWLTDGGHGAVERLVRHRADPGARRTAVCDALLGFLHKRDLAGQEIVHDSEFFESPWGLFYLDRFRFDELEAARKFLLAEGLVVESTLWGPLPVITPAGQRVAGSGRSVMDAASPPAGSTYSTTVTNSTGVNVAQGSPGATQSVTLSPDEIAQVDQLLAAVRALFTGSDPSTAEVAEVAGLTGELEVAARATVPSRERVGHLVARLAAAVGNAMAQAATAALVGPVVQLAEHLAHALGV